ncbi:hypothetical protein KJ835_03195 [Patescibacteria group bacterium]|nr:hypothetical protein [Patescibacteria group bacterium]MBU1953404.1 hypothetical protein [Patescibacteria group bacterium]
MIPIDTRNASAKAFPMNQFRELFAKSYSMSLLTLENRDLIEKAMVENDVTLLEKIYSILLQEQASDRKIAEEFSVDKNRILDDYLVTATDIRRSYLETPMKEKIANAATEEKIEAEEILKKYINN